MSDEETTPQQPFVTMDAVMLMKQTERIEALDASIQQLATALSARPTKASLDHDRRKARNRVAAVLIVMGLVLTGLVYQNFKIKQSCVDRNTNASNFRTLLLVLVDPSGSTTPAPTDPRSIRTQKALNNYILSLKPINC